MQKVGISEDRCHNGNQVVISGKNGSVLWQVGFGLQRFSLEVLQIDINIWDSLAEFWRLLLEFQHAVRPPHCKGIRIPFTIDQPYL